MRLSPVTRSDYYGEEDDGGCGSLLVGGGVT